ncbi:MAG: hypothetical protein ACTICQ_11250 [Glutamicibacter arilaitensis]|uniref:hypothetical protein n=1 Tax=Glutamicibacter arilaitensis TaxID=256701 RepID=UPI003FB6A3E9
MPVSVIPEDIAGIWRPLSEAESVIVPGLSNQAWIRLLVPRPDLEQHLADGTVSLESVASAMISMIIRVLKNPDSVRQLAKSYDDWSRSQTFDNSVSTGELYVNEHELALVTPKPAILPAGAYSVSLWG